MILLEIHVHHVGLFFFIASVMQTHRTEHPDRHSELQAPPQQTEEESGDLIRPQKPLNPLTASKSHQELHKELRMTNKRQDRHTNSCKHSHFSFIFHLNHKVLLWFWQESVARRKEWTPEGFRKEEMGAEDEGKQGSGGGKEQVTASSGAVEKTWEAGKGLHWSCSVFISGFKKKNIWLTNHSSWIKK